MPADGLTLVERFLTRLSRSGPVRKPELGPCWTWRGDVRDGYGWYRHRGEGSQLAHRFGYEALVGEVRAGRKLMNLCGCRACCNPTHWKPTR